jgi:hypothetical protein
MCSTSPALKDDQEQMLHAFAASPQQREPMPFSGIHVHQA